MSPLTILTGVNGCGKTSIIESLLLLRQSYMKRRIMAGLDLNKPLCNVGIEQDARYYFSTDGIIKFDFDIDRDRTYEFQYQITSSQSKTFINKLRYSDNINEETLSKLSLFNNDFQYVSSARWGGRSSYPRETYMVETQKQLSSENGIGDLVAHFLYHYGADPMMSYLELGKETTLIEETEAWERVISPNVTIRPEPSTGDTSSFIIRYGFLSMGEKKNITDLKGENVGFGISYSLSVIVALLSAAPGALVIIENPEAHIHPKGQSEIAQLIALVADRGVQVIIETHSDHIINGIMKACRMRYEKQQGISSESVSIYYIGEKDEMQASVCQTVKIDSDGTLESQPLGFFDQIEKDMYYIYNHRSISDD